MKTLRRADRQMTTANKCKLGITSVSDAGKCKDLYYVLEASKNIVNVVHHG